MGQWLWGTERRGTGEGLTSGAGEVLERERCEGTGARERGAMEGVIW